MSARRHGRPRPVHSMRSLHGFTPGVNGLLAVQAAPAAAFGARRGRRLHTHNSMRSLRPAGRLGRLLTHPPHLHRLLTHLLSQAPQLVLPGLLALTGIAGPLLLVGLLRARTRRRLARSLTALRILPGREGVDPAALTRALAALHGLLPAWHRRLLGETPWLLLELERDPSSGLQLRLVLPRQALPLATSALRGALPGCELHPHETTAIALPAGAIRGRLHQRAGRLAPLGASTEPVLPSLLSALETERGSAVVQITLQPATSRWLGQLYAAAETLESGRRKRPLASKLVELPLTLTQEALTGIAELAQRGSGSSSSSKTEVAGRPSLLESDLSRALRTRARTGGVAFDCSIRFACHAGHPAPSKAWAQAIQAQFRPLEGPHNGLAPSRVRPWQRASFDRTLQGRLPETGILLTAEELVPLFSIGGNKRLAELEQAGARQVPPPLTLAASSDDPDGRLFAVSTYPGRERNVRLTRVGARTHLHVLGPPGSGKTSLLLRLALDSAQAGDGTGIWEAKGDLARSFLLALPDTSYDRLCLVDLAADELVIGLNPLEWTDEDDRERVADDTLSIFKRRFQRFWGPQTDDLFKGALRTLLLIPGSTLLELPLLLTDPQFRARYLDKVNDPVALGPFWQRYEALSAAGQAQAIGPVLNKLRDFLFRSRLRAMLGQPHSTVSFDEILAKRLILVMNLPKGAGRETAEVVGAFSLAKLWQAALARCDLPERERADFHCYLDEFQNFLHAEDFAEILAEARALRLSLCLAHQTLAQLNERETSLLLNLVRNLVCFQPGHEDAARLARSLAPSFDRDDLHRLGPYQVAVRLAQHGATAAAFSARTLPPPSFDPAPWIEGCRTRPLQLRNRADEEHAATSRLVEAAAAAWPSLAPDEREEALAQLASVLAGRRRPLAERVQALEQLPSDRLDRYQQLTAALRQLQRQQLLALEPAQIQQRINTVALARARRSHDADDAGSSPKDTALLQTGLSEEEWASAVEQERLQRLRRISALRYGRPVDEVEVAIRGRLGGALPLPANDGAEDIP